MTSKLGPIERVTYATVNSLRLPVNYIKSLAER